MSEGGRAGTGICAADDTTHTDTQRLCPSAWAG